MGLLGANTHCWIWEIKYLLLYFKYFLQRSPSLQTRCLKRLEMADGNFRKVCACGLPVSQGCLTWPVLTCPWVFSELCVWFCYSVGIFLNLHCMGPVYPPSPPGTSQSCCVSVSVLKILALSSSCLACSLCPLQCAIGRVWECVVLGFASPVCSHCLFWCWSGSKEFWPLEVGVLRSRAGTPLWVGLWSGCYLGKVITSETNKSRRWS